MDNFSFSNNILLILAIINTFGSIYVLVKGFNKKDTIAKIVGILTLTASILLVYSLITRD